MPEKTLIFQPRILESARENIQETAREKKCARDKNGKISPEKKILCTRKNRHYTR